MYNAVVHIHSCFSADKQKEIVNISIVTPDNKEHEIDIAKEDFVLGRFWIPAEYFVHPACCEHPDGCPGGSRTEKFLEEKNNE